MSASDAHHPLIRDPGDVERLVANVRAGNNGLAASFAYLAATRPDWFEPFREEVILEDRVIGAGLGDYCLLLRGTPDRCVGHLADAIRRDPTNPDIRWKLAGIGTPTALQALADLARHIGLERECRDDGVEIPSSGPATYRFALSRRAIFLLLLEGPVEATTHPIGLPLADVVSGDDRRSIVWHYLSLSTSELPSDVPSWPTERVHLVAPVHDWAYKVVSAIDTHGRLLPLAVEADETDWAPNESDEPSAAAGVFDYDGRLTYMNGHVFATPGLIGVAGGPHLLVGPNPSCLPGCGRLMFHVATITTWTRRYGEGFRGLFICEDCQRTASTGSGWN